jgi:hypothetical protein
LEGEIRRLAVESQLRQIVRKILSQKKKTKKKTNSTKQGWWSSSRGKVPITTRKNLMQTSLFTNFNSKWITGPTCKMQTMSETSKQKQEKIKVA